MPKRTAMAMLAVLLLAAATGLAPAESFARTKKILPSSFQPGRPSAPGDYQRTPGYIAGLIPSGVLFVAPVRLPVGSRITNVKLSLKGSVDGTTVFLGRKRFAEGEETLLFQSVPPPGATWQLLDLPLDANADRIVRAGYTYYLAVTVYQSAQFGGIQIGYK